MNIAIPAKTFLVGEYIALTGGPAIVLTTTPCFELRKSNTMRLHGIHPKSPAGRLWYETAHENLGLTWHDPYYGIGGVGASSAEFIGVYHAINTTHKVKTKDLLDAYLRLAYSGQGVAPSGYDVIAQSSSKCVFIDNQQTIASYAWSFADVSFVLAHTKKKIATHQHLEMFKEIKQFEQLKRLVLDAQQAFVNKDSKQLINSINSYHKVLINLDLVAQHTQNIIKQLQTEPDLLAAKGCGAMGADVILLIVPSSQQEKWQKKIIPKYMHWIADKNTLYSPGSIENCSLTPA